MTRASIIMTIIALIVVQMASYTVSFEPGSALESLSSAQRLYREMVSEQNARLISSVNKLNLSFSMVPNNFIAMTNDEFVATMASPQPPTSQDVSLPFIGETIRVDQQMQIDWNKAGYVTKVKDQGRRCSSCYAFTAVADIETSLLMRYGVVFDLSEQQIVDCSGGQRGNLGCRGGFYYYSFEFTRQWGLTHQASYPYSGKAGQCHQQKGHYKIRSMTKYNGNSCNLLTQWLQKRPVIVSLDGINVYWQFYGGGILTKCGNQLNHGVQVTGLYQFANGTGYYVAKNSWGTGWGERGYIRIDRSIQGGNLCQICSYPYYSVL